MTITNLPELIDVNMPNAYFVDDFEERIERRVESYMNRADAQTDVGEHLAVRL